jgi:hypothetical protein
VTIGKKVKFLIGMQYASENKLKIINDVIKKGKWINQVDDTIEYSVELAVYRN